MPYCFASLSRRYLHRLSLRGSRSIHVKAIRRCCKLWYQQDNNKTCSIPWLIFAPRLGCSGGKTRVEQRTSGVSRGTASTVPGRSALSTVTPRKMKDAVYHKSKILVYPGICCRRLAVETIYFESLLLFLQPTQCTALRFKLQCD